MNIELIFFFLVGAMSYCVIAAIGLRWWRKDHPVIIHHEDEDGFDTACAVLWPLFLAFVSIFAVGWVITWPARYVWNYGTEPPEPPEPVPPEQPILNYPIESFEE